MKILIINGPNLNMLGIRETEIYGDFTYAELIDKIYNYCDIANIDVDIHQSNCEGKIIDLIHSAYFIEFDGVVINPAAYTHTSIAILDAIKAIDPIPVVECHISDIDKREDFRKQSFITSACVDIVSGFGDNSYINAIEILVKVISNKKK